MSHVCGRKDPFIEARTESVACASQSLQVLILLIGFIESLEVQLILKLSCASQVLPSPFILDEQYRIGIHLIVEIGTQDRFLEM